MDHVRPDPPRPPTYDDLLALPDHVVGEILDGELHVTPRWWILDEPELHLGPDVLVPDLVGWRRERLPAMPGEPYFSLAADWVCEILSPATARLDRLKKRRLYARESVRNAWLVDPLAQTLEVLRLDQSRWTIVTVHGGGDIVRAEPFEGIAIELARLWAESGS